MGHRVCTTSGGLSGHSKGDEEWIGTQLENLKGTSQEMGLDHCLGTGQDMEHCVGTKARAPSGHRKGLASHLRYWVDTTARAWGLRPELNYSTGLKTGARGWDQIWSIGLPPQLGLTSQQAHWAGTVKAMSWNHSWSKRWHNS